MGFSTDFKSIINSLLAVSNSYALQSKGTIQWLKLDKEYQREHSVKYNVTFICTEFPLYEGTNVRM